MSNEGKVLTSPRASLSPSPSLSLKQTQQQPRDERQQHTFADASVTVTRPASGKAASPPPAPPPTTPRDNTNGLPAPLHSLGPRSLPNAAAVAAYLGTATAKATTTQPAMPAALSGLAQAVASQPAAADVVAAALDLHAMSRAAVVNRPNIARMDALGAACVSALDRAGRRQQRQQQQQGDNVSPPPAPLPADICLAVAAVLRDCGALAEGFGREGWLLRLACGGAALRDEAEMLHGAALELLARGGLGWAVPSAAQQRRAALALAALAGEGAAAALLAALEAEGAEAAAAAGAGAGGGHHHPSRGGGGGPSPSRLGGHGSVGGGGASGGGGSGNNNNNNNNSSASQAGAGAGAGYVDASRPLRRALRQLGRGRGLAAGVAAAAADPDAADELARLLGVSPAALQAELRAVPVADGADDYLAGLLGGGGGSGAVAVEAAVAAPVPAAPVPPAPPAALAAAAPPPQPHSPQHHHHHARLDLDALHAQLLTRRDAAAFLRAGGQQQQQDDERHEEEEEAVGQSPAPEPAPAAPAAAPAPPRPSSPSSPSRRAAQPAPQPYVPPKLRHPAAFARYSTFDPPLGDPSAGVSFAGVRAALHELGLLPSSSDGCAWFSPLSSSSDAAVRRHMALALGWASSGVTSGGGGGGGGHGGGGGAASAAPSFMPPETFDRFYEGVLAANPRARVADAAGLSAEADLRRVHAAYAAFGHSRGGGGSGAGSGGGASSSRSPIAVRPVWTGVIGRSGVASSAGGGNADGGPLLDSAHLSKLLRECGLLPALSSQHGAASRVLPSPLVRLTAADVDIVYTKCCVAAAAAASAAASSAGGGSGGGRSSGGSGGGAWSGGGAAGASPSPSRRAHASPSAASPSPPPAFRRAGKGRGLDFDGFCAALIALSERTGAPLQTVLGAVAASNGPVACGPSSVYYGAASVAGTMRTTTTTKTASAAVAAPPPGALRSSRPSAASGGGGGKAAAAAARAAAPGSVAGSNVGAAWRR